MQAGYRTWKSLIGEALKDAGETFEDVVSTTLSDKELNKGFYAGYGGTNGLAFTLWTKNRVYFPVSYDGAEWAASAPRNPCDEAVNHVGGG